MMCFYLLCFWFAMHVGVIVLVYMCNLGRSLVLCALLYDNFVMPVKMERCSACQCRYSSGGSQTSSREEH